MAHRCISTSLLAELLKATEQGHQQVMQSLLPNQPFKYFSESGDISPLLLFLQQEKHS